MYLPDDMSEEELVDAAEAVRELREPVIGIKVDLPTSFDSPLEFTLEGDPDFRSNRWDHVPVTFISQFEAAALKEAQRMANEAEIRLNEIMRLAQDEEDVREMEREAEASADAWYGDSPEW